MLPIPGSKCARGQSTNLVLATLNHLTVRKTASELDSLSGLGLMSRVYVKAYGDVRPGNKTFGTVLDGSKVVIQNRAFLKSDTAKSDTQDFIEKHREEMMRQMYLRSGYGLQ